MGTFTCENGHLINKKSTCKTCPKCEKEQRNAKHKFHGFSAPAKRALANAGITNIVQLQRFSKNELLSLHGLGKTSIPKIIQLLHEFGLALKDE